MCILLVVISMPINCGLTYNADHAILLGIPDIQTSYLLGIFGVTNIVSRLIIGSIIDVFRSKIFIVTFLIMIQFTLIFSIGDFFPSITGQVLVFGSFGLTYGTYYNTSGFLNVRLLFYVKLKC